MKRNITSKRTVEVRSVHPGASPDGPLFAINWLNTRSSLLYTTYTLLAAHRVRKIGGGPVFKGRTMETLAGSESQARDILLIVRYPSASSFLSLITDRLFQLVSPLRMAALKSLSFVFNQRLDSQTSAQEGREVRPLAGDLESAYAAVMYHSGGDSAAELAALREVAASHEMSVEFFGTPTASLAFGHTDGGEQDLPFVTDRVAILRAGSTVQLERFAAAELITALGAAEAPWIGRMERSL